jgi:hypothetical protein
MSKQQGQNPQGIPDPNAPTGATGGGGGYNPGGNAPAVMPGGGGNYPPPPTAAGGYGGVPGLQPPGYSPGGGTGTTTQMPPEGGPVQAEPHQQMPAGDIMPERRNAPGYAAPPPPAGGAAPGGMPAPQRAPQPTGTQRSQDIYKKKQQNPYGR